MDLLFLMTNPEMDIIIVEDISCKTLCEGNLLELLMLNGGKAKNYFNRKVHCITNEKWRGAYYPAHQIIIVVDEWELK